MTETKVKKLISHLRNIAVQIECAQDKLGSSMEEQQTYRALGEAATKVKEAIERAEKIKPEAPMPQKPGKKRIRQMQIEKAHPIVDLKPKPAPKSEPMCRYLVKVLDKSGTIIEKRCKVHMDMDYCGRNCPYNTNIAYGARSKPYMEKGI